MPPTVENVGKLPILANEDEDDIGKVDVSFSHVHLYTDRMLPSLQSYITMQDRLNKLSTIIHNDKKSDSATASPNTTLDVTKYGHIWIDDILSIPKGTTGTEATTSSFESHERDPIAQLLHGFGFRIAASHFTEESRSVLVASPDPDGIQFVITAVSDHPSNEEVTDEEQTAGEESLHSKQDVGHFYFQAQTVRNFYSANNHRQGIAVLAFEVTSGSLRDIYLKYLKYHPNLLAPPQPQPLDDAAKESRDKEESYYLIEYDNMKILEVYAYYTKDSYGSVADTATRLRFVQYRHPVNVPLPGLKPVSPPPIFPPDASRAYPDHWVSNVYDRNGFLKILEDTLGFAPKVDFNAGVIAAGEAQIESTVTGNLSSFEVNEIGDGDGGEEKVLRDKSQVYLPINNTLSRVGHVHGFLEEVGQGVQHIASRVEDIIGFVQRGNDYRKITGEGFTFLNIPRSYYGILTAQHLLQYTTSITSEFTASDIVNACSIANIITKDGAVDLELTKSDISRLLDQVMKEHNCDPKEVVASIFLSRYVNICKLLGEGCLTEEQYLGIVRNKILVDVQGDDLLFQIFTSSILQRNAGEEAPFLEFIQRVCSCRGETNPAGIKRSSLLKPGCGGFGIRNFLTLFLSIEVSKAMHNLSQAKTPSQELFYSQIIQIFTEQLNESNPILTKISNAMIREGHCKQMFDESSDVTWDQEKIKANSEKQDGNQDLMECSCRYKDRMRKLREDHELK